MFTSSRIPAPREVRLEVTVAIRVNTDADSVAPLVAELSETVRGALAPADLRVSIAETDPGHPGVIGPRRVLRAAPPLSAIPPADPARQAALRIVPGARRVYFRGAEITLTRLEFDLLHFLCAAPGRVHTRSVLLARVWDTLEPLGTRTVDVHIRRLRRKLGDDNALITTVRGVGYRINDESSVAIEAA